jgi:hypothetical protein
MYPHYALGVNGYYWTTMDNNGQHILGFIRVTGYLMDGIGRYCSLKWCPETDSNRHGREAEGF